MCLYPTTIRNRKYISNKKNGGSPPAIRDERCRDIQIGCGRCIECRKEKAREWLVRLSEDIKTHRDGKFITLTFSTESFEQIRQMRPNKAWPGCEHLEGYDLDNEVATHAVKLFRERWRRKYKTSLRHWLVTELGHKGTENVHLHGIIWTDKPLTEVEKIWTYGWVWKGKLIEGTLHNYVNGRTIGYSSKYIHKTDQLHKSYKAIILTSPGIGKNYIGTYNSKRNLFRGRDTDATYKMPSGHKISLPLYYRGKLYNPEERELLWRYQLDKCERWVLGQRIDVSKSDEEYKKALECAREFNKELGYGGPPTTWERQVYERKRRMLLQQTRRNNQTREKEPAKRRDPELRLRKRALDAEYAYREIDKILTRSGINRTRAQ